MIYRYAVSRRELVLVCTCRYQVHAPTSLVVLQLWYSYLHAGTLYAEADPRRLQWLVL